ncbi:MAG TPA: hypothetical protein VNW47_02250 [Terriglobales bacterium]|jgi:hypothetical protein|nr:hypothetical protein [Terriglobales bacterium]
MKRTTILVCTLAAGMAWAQNPQIIQNTHAQLSTVAQNNTAASNQALEIKATPIPTKTVSAKPAAAMPKATVAPAKASASSAKVTASPVKPAVVPAKAVASSAKPKVVAVSQSASKSASPTTAKSAEPFAQKKASATSAAPKLGVKPVKEKKVAKPAAKKKAVAETKAPAPAAASGSTDSASVSSEDGKGDDDAVKAEQDKKWSMSGKRDPFISPVVSHAGGSGCSTGKKCLEIGAINLRGVVHSDGSFIAVVTNNLNKAYFLRENDPVFDGYVVKITGDSIVFKATMQDRLGKTFTREVTKKITTPAV